jgi:hypothetical protein
MINVSPFKVEGVGDGVIRELSADGRLVIFVIRDDNPTTVRTWVRGVVDFFNDDSADKPRLVLYDLHRTEGASFHSYLSEALKTLYKFRPELERHVAVMLPNVATVEAARLAIRLSQLELGSPYPLTWEFFTKRPLAMRWLMSQAD